jgi:hypothetical protein
MQAPAATKFVRITFSIWQSWSLFQLRHCAPHDDRYFWPCMQVHLESRGFHG